MISDLFDIIHTNYCNGDIEETIAVVNEIIEAMLLSNKFAYMLQEECEEFASKYNKCSKCGGNLICEEHEEIREYYGREVSEIISEYSCENGCRSR